MLWRRRFRLLRARCLLRRFVITRMSEQIHNPLLRVLLLLRIRWRLRLMGSVWLRWLLRVWCGLRQCFRWR